MQAPKPPASQTTMKTNRPFQFSSHFSVLSPPIIDAILLYRIHQRRESLDPHFQFISALDRADAAGRAGQNHIAGQQREVRRDEADEFGGFENELLRVRVLAQQAVLEKLDVQFVRIDL